MIHPQSKRMSKQEDHHDKTEGKKREFSIISQLCRHKQKAKIALTWMFATIAIICVIGGIGVGIALGYSRLYDHRIFPGVRVLGVRLDGLTENEARITLNQRIDEALKDGLRFTFQNREITLNAITVGQEDPDISSDLIRYQIDQPIESAMQFGRSGNWIVDLYRRWSARIHPAHITTPIELNKDAIKSGIQHSADDISPAPKNAQIKLTWDTVNNRTQTEMTEEQSGIELDLDKAFEILQRQAGILTFAPIAVTGKEVKAEILKSDLESLASQADAWVKHAPFTLTSDLTDVDVDLQRFANWTVVEKTSDGKLQFTIDRARFHEDIRTLTSIEELPKNGSLEFKDGKLISFEPGTTGTVIDDEATIQNILSGIGTTTTMALIVKQEEGTIGGEDPKKLGIKEIIGIGTSDFKNSPVNRTKNIAIGVSKVNGTLIAPGEEFSMLKTIGEITAEQGWLPELVIKGNKTMPELGGGLCQIGTTAFRAALNAGMKITERRNHSYRVSYYEPAGTDATIYDPSPDFKFINDTANYILIHAYIKGTIITYEFWGTKDGRVVSVPKPRIYNITSPPPMKLIETLDLAPGKKKCTESAHAGADASLDYKVTYADGTVYEETFNSHYRPWQAVCLIGVEKLTETPSTEGTSTSSTTETVGTPAE
jgi:vancomycin resistance protein YoaR